MYKGTMRELIRVLVVDDHEMLAEALGLLFSRHPVFELVGCTSDADDAVGMTIVDEPDVVLMDLQLAGIDPLQTVRMIKSARRSTRVVVVASSNDRPEATELAAAGASGYVEKTRAVEEVLDLVRRVAGGATVMPDVGVRGPAAQPRSSRAAVAELALRRLTSRETEILQALAAGDSLSVVAERLGISRSTVENHVKSILGKLGVHSKMEAVRLAWRHGLPGETRTA